MMGLVAMVAFIAGCVYGQHRCRKEIKAMLSFEPYFCMFERLKNFCDSEKWCAIDMILLYLDKNPDKITFIDQDLIDSNLPVNNKNRCKLLLEKYINQPYTSLKIGYKSNYADLLIVDYDQIVNNSQDTIDKICDFIGIDRIVVDLNNLQPMDENDAYHGFIGLHDVRKELKRTSPRPEDVIGKDLAKHYTDMKVDFWNRA